MFRALGKGIRALYGQYISAFNIKENWKVEKACAQAHSKKSSSEGQNQFHTILTAMSTPRIILIWHSEIQRFTWKNRYRDSIPLPKKVRLDWLTLTLQNIITEIVTAFWFPLRLGIVWNQIIVYFRFKVSMLNAIKTLSNFG